MNVLSSSDEEIRVNGVLMPRNGTSDKLFREDNSTLVLCSKQFPIICTNISGVYVRIYERESASGIDVKLYLSTVGHSSFIYY